jgi:hypothetical protein
MALSLSFQGKVRVSSREKLTTTNAGILRYAQDDDGTETADPCGMTNKRTSKGQAKGTSKDNQKVKRRQTRLLVGRQARSDRFRLLAECGNPVG